MPLLKKLEQVGTVQVMFLMTCIGTLLSVGIVVAVLSIVAGFDFARQIPLGVLWTTAVSFSIVIPVIATPIVGYRMIAVLRALEQAREDLTRIAQTDQLTRLLNRRGFEEACEKVLPRAADEGKPAAVLMCDIDHFKTINDQHGHEFGDVSLKMVADVIRETLANHEAITARHGGEEFAILLAGLTEREVMAAAEALRRSCEMREVCVDEQKRRVTMSVGVAMASHALRDMGRLMREADVALYRAKRMGRNRVVVEHLPLQAAS